MALYAALTFWLVVIMFAAWGVHQLWSSLVRPRVVNFVLLPGTLVAELGHVLGLLLSGSAVRNTVLIANDKAEPKSETPDQPRLPVIGPILVGLLPLVACAACVHLIARLWGGAVLMNLSQPPALQVPQALPMTLTGMWTLLHDALDLMQNLLGGVLRTDLTGWRTVLFLYLAVCLTVRMAPFEGNRRGGLGAVLLAAVVISVLALLLPTVRTFIAESSWPILSFAVGLLLTLLLLSLLVRGLVGCVRILAGKE